MRYIPRAGAFEPVRKRRMLLNWVEADLRTTQHRHVTFRYGKRGKWSWSLFAGSQAEAWSSKLTQPHCGRPRRRVTSSVHSVDKKATASSERKMG